MHLKPRMWRYEPISESDQRAIGIVRAEVAGRVLCGRGIEVGAGSRPFPLPPTAVVIHGDIRDEATLRKYFQARNVRRDEVIDAQSFTSIPDGSIDFLISAHVIEHLRDPIGSVVQGLRTLRTGKPYVLVVPEMHETFDRDRPETTVEHVLRDSEDGGENSCYQAYEEHLRFVHPCLTGQTYDEAEIARQARESARRWREFDIHFHAWSRRGFELLLAAATAYSQFSVADAVSVADENIFVLLKGSG